MKKILFLAATLVLLPAISASTYTNKRSSTINLSILDNTAYAGGFFIVLLKDPPNSAKAPECVFENKYYQFFNLNDVLTAIIPIPFDFKSEKHEFKIEVDGKSIIENFTVQKRNVRTSNLPSARPLPLKILKRIAREREKALKIFSTTANDRLFNNEFILPVSDKHSSSISDEYGVKRVRPGRSYYHAGVDFKTPAGEKIFATSNALVAYTGTHYLDGSIIILDHGAGIHSVYIHLSKIIIKKGMFVKKGAVIALSGKSGAVARGAHLHFVIKIKNNPVDPILFIKTINILNKKP